MLSANITANQIKLNLVTKEIIDSISSSCYKQLSDWGESVYYYVTSKPSPIIEEYFRNNKIEIDEREYPFETLGSLRESLIPEIDDIIVKEKYASDYVMATTLLEIGYEIDNMFKANYLTGNLINPLDHNDFAYIYDNKSNLTTDELVKEHGLILQYKITIEED